MTIKIKQIYLSVGVCNMTRGIVIIAAGTHIYGQWAMNLLMGLKTADSTIDVTLLWQGKSLDLIQHLLGNFNKVIEIPKECTTRKGLPSLLRTIVCLYDLSPYDETIYIDADVITFHNKSISILFDELKDVDITIGNRGKIDLNTDPKLIWAKSKDMKDKFGEVTLYNLSSEFIYFKKTNKVREFFNIAKEAFDEPGIDYTRFAGTVPDELAFQIAMIKTGIKPHKEIFLPFYWEPYMKKNKTIDQLYKEQYYGYSIGGATLNHQQKQIYDSLAKMYAKGFGIKYPFLSRNKRDFLPERKDI